MTLLSSAAPWAKMLGGVNIIWRGLYGANVRSGYRPGSQTGALLDDFNATASHGDTMVFRTWEKIPGNWRLNNLPIPKDAPLLETFGLGAYHEKLLAVKYVSAPMGDMNTITTTEFEQGGVTREVDNPRLAQAKGVFAGMHTRAELIERTNNFQPQQFFDNPISGPLSGRDDAGVAMHFAGGGNERYNWFSNNCHRHAYFVMKGMGLR